MTSTTVDPSRKPVLAAPQWMRIRAGQVVAAQAAVALVLAAAGRGPLLVSAAGVVAAMVFVVAFARVRDRWLFQWLAAGVRYATRRHVLPAQTAPGDLIRFLVPDLATTPDGGFVDADGLVAVFELDQPVLATAPFALPDITGLVDIAGPVDQVADPPQARLDLLIAADRPRMARTAAAASYRQLTQDSVLAQCRIFVVLRVVRPPGWSNTALRPTMSSISRRVARRIGPHRRLDRDDALATVAELAHHDGRSRVGDRWPFVTIGGLWQACYRMTLPNPPGEESSAHRARVVGRLLGLPAAATTVSAAVTAAPDVVLRVRLAGESPQHLAHADQALGQLAAAAGAAVQRLDGDHRCAVAETLPFAGHSATLGLPTRGKRTLLPRSTRAVAPESPSTPGNPGRPRPSPRPRRGSSQPAGPVEVAPASEALPPAGMVLGYDRHGAPLVARLFRPTGTRIVVVGALPTAQIFALRALALGARIDVRTRRWAGWHEFAEELGAASGAMTVTPDAEPLQRWARSRGAPLTREPTASSSAAQPPTARPQTTSSLAARPATARLQTTPPPSAPRSDGHGPGAGQPRTDWPSTGWRGSAGAVGTGRPGSAQLSSSDSGASPTASEPSLTIVDVATRGTSARLESSAHPESPTHVDGVERDAGGKTAGGGKPDPRAARSARRHVLEVGNEDEADDGPAVDNQTAVADPGQRWRAVLTVRDELTETDVELLTAADLVVLGPLGPGEAAIAAGALGFGAATEWLSRIRADMVAVISGDSLRWAVLAATPIEQSVIGPATDWHDAATPNDVDALQSVTRSGNSL